MDAIQQQSWIQQWQAAAEALAEVRRDELAAMSEADAAAAALSIMSLPLGEDSVAAERDGAQTSGLVIQQAIFARARRS
jgi:hypothetical protein